MSFENVLVETGENFIGTITLNRPEQLNTFSLQLAAELADALRKLDEDPDVRVIIVTGAGKAFCAGIDLSGYFGKTMSEYREWVQHMEEPLVLISRMNKPVIAKVNGAAAAIGAGLAASADLAIASEKAKIGLTAINVGLNCVGPIVPVARSVGRKKAMELLLYGDLISAAEAMEMGLFNRVVPKEDLDAEALNWAKILAEKSPVAVQNAKTAFYTASDMDYYKQFQYMNEAFARLCSTEEAKEGVSAFFEKRKPNW